MMWAGAVYKLCMEKSIKSLLIKIPSSESQYLSNICKCCEHLVVKFLVLGEALWAVVQQGQASLYKFNRLEKFIIYKCSFPILSNMQS